MLPSRPSGTIATALGYRWFLARWVEDERPRTATIQAGLVKLTEGEDSGRVGYRSDSGRGLERWLLETGRDRLDRAPLAAVEDALRAEPST